MAGEIRTGVGRTSTVAAYAMAVGAVAVSSAALAETVSHHRTFIVWCRDFFLANLGDYGGWGLSVVALAVLATATAAFSGIWFLVRELMRGRMLGRHLRRRRLVASAKVVRSCAEMGMTGVEVIDDPEPYAFTAGLLFPRIRLSRGLVSMLSLAELRAVVRHEGHHARRRHPLQSLCIGAVSRAFFFLPSLKDVAEHLAVVREVHADRAASAGTGGRRALVSALEKTMAVARPHELHGEAVAHFSRVRSRVRALAAEDGSVELRLGLVRLAVSVAMTLLIVAASGVAGNVAQAHEGSGGAGMVCPAPETLRDVCIEISPFLKLDTAGPMSRLNQSPYLDR